MEHKTKKNWLTQVTELLCAFLLLLCPMVITAGLAMLEVLVIEEAGEMPEGLAIFCALVVVLLWLGTAVLTKLRLGTSQRTSLRTRLFHGPMPKTGLVLSGMLVLSVLFSALAFAAEQDVIELGTGLWAFARLLGSPALTAMSGVQAMLGCEIGTAAMLTCGGFLLIGLVAAVPVTGKKKTKRKPAKVAL